MIEIYISRAIDLQELIGNIGGYIGLLLGYSILQIPDFLRETIIKATQALTLQNINVKKNGAKDRMISCSHEKKDVYENESTHDVHIQIIENENFDISKK